MIRRNSFVISKALKNFLSASVMTSLAGQLAVTTDAVIVSHMVGPNALSAINMVMPLTMFFSCFSILIGLGASILAAKAIGNHDKERVDRIFTISLILLTVAGIAVSGLSFSYCHEIVGIACDNIIIAPLAYEYTRVITSGALFLIISNGINYFVSTDGNPGLVTKGVAAGAVANAILDIMLIEQMGISGSAWATIINYVITLVIVSSHFFTKRSSYHLVNPIKGAAAYIIRNLYEGLPLMLGNLLLGGAVFIINSMILDAAGADGAYIWAVCLQVLMLTFVILNGVGNAMLSIGGIQMGEKDYNGIKILTTLALKLVSIVLTSFMLLILLFPGIPEYMFAADDTLTNIDISGPIRIFSLFLVPFAITLVMRFLFQILEHRILSLIMSAGQLVGIIASLWIFIKIAPDGIWWSFPVSAAVLILIQLAATFAIYLVKRDISPLTLIPKRPDGELSADFSVSYSNGFTGHAIERIDSFLTECNVTTAKRKVLKESYRNLIAKLEQHKGKKKSFDIHVRVIGENVMTIVRDAGKRIDSLTLSSDKAYNIEHKYMYGQNVFLLQLKL